MACNPYAAAPAGQATYAARSALGKRSAAYALPWRSACVLLGKQQETFPYESMTWHPVHCSDIEAPRRPLSRDGLNLGKLGMLASTQR